MIGKTVYEDEWILIFVSNEKPKTYVFDVNSKCDNCHLGSVYWFNSWRNYVFEPTSNIILSDRCMFAIASFTMWINAQHKMKYKNLKGVNHDKKEQ